MLLVIDRNIKSSKWNMGSLTDPSHPEFQLATLENPWENNEPYISCIPKNNEYQCERVDSPRFGNTFQILDVVGRTHILFHVGNWERQTQGCILLGLSQNPRADMITKSRQGFGLFIKHTQNIDEFTLEIN